MLSELKKRCTSYACLNIFAARRGKGVGWWKMGDTLLQSSAKENDAPNNQPFFHESNGRTHTWTTSIHTIDHFHIN